MIEHHKHASLIAVGHSTKLPTLSFKNRKTLTPWLKAKRQKCFIFDSDRGAPARQPIANI